MTENAGVFKEWTSRYLIEYLVALILCIGSVAFCIPLARHTPIRSARMLLMAVPTAAILLMALVVYRHFRRIDEFLRREMVEAFAVAAAFTAIWTLSYYTLELVGFPRLSTGWVWGAMFVVWNLWIFGKWALRR